MEDDIGGNEGLHREGVTVERMGNTVVDTVVDLIGYGERIGVGEYPMLGVDPF